MIGPIRRGNRALIAGLVACGAVAAAATTSIGVSAGGSAQPGRSVEGATDSLPLVIARNMDLSSLDPHRQVCDTCQFVYTTLYQTLVGLGPDNETLVPGLAESWEVNDDSTVYTFHLDPAATFSDGSPVESKDVAFSFMRMKNIGTSLTYLVDDIESIDTSDPATAVVTLAAPNAEFLNHINAAYTVIVNSDVVAEQGGTDAEDAATTDDAEAWFMNNSAGSGPYVLGEYIEGDHITLEANPNYWSDAPPISTIVVQQAETAAAQAQMLQSGDADIAMQIDPITARSLEGVDGVTVENVPSFNFVYIALWQGIENGTTHALDDDVRAAIRAGIDFEALIDTLLDGAGSTQPSPIPNGFPGSEGLEMPAYDPEAARQGIIDAGAEGLTFTLGYPAINAYGIDYGQMAQLIQQQMADIGVTVELAPDTFSTFIDKFVAFEYPAVLLYWAPDFFGSSQYVSYFGLVQDARAAKESAASNDDQLIDQVTTDAFAAAMSTSDPAEQAAQYNIAARQMLSQNIVIPLIAPDMVLAYRSDVTGVNYSACCNIDLSRISRTG